MELLLHWMRKQEIEDNMRWKDAAIHQECFIRDVICARLLDVHAFVASTHCSKSIILPVYAFMMRNGVKVICRENFYGWKISVKLPKKRPYASIIPTDIMESHSYGEDTPSCYFEGFRDSWVYPGYNPNDVNQTKFSFGIYNDYNFYMAMYFLKNLYGEMDLTNEASKLTREDVVSTINTLLQNQGYYEKKYEQSGDKTYESRLMSGWDIIHYTGLLLEDFDFRKKYDLEYMPMDTYDNPEELANRIIKYPESVKEFVMEKKMYEFEL